MGRFDDKVLLVTGGGSGIGAATAHRFGAEGATVVITGRTQEKLDKVVADAPAGATLIARVADTSDEQAVSQLISDVVTEHGRLDTLVNNAAVAEPGTATGTPARSPVSVP